MVALVLSPFACSDDPTGPPALPPDPVGADSTASVWMGALGDTLAALQGMDEDALRNADFQALRNGFQQALTQEANNHIANLGLAILALLELNYNDEIWQLVDDLRIWSQGGGPSPAPPDRHRTVIGRQFELMVEMPFSFYTRLAMGTAGDISLARIQNTIKTVVIPALDRAVNHIEATEQHTDTEIRIPVVVWGDFDTDTVKIDLGEIYVFSSALYALRSSFKSLIAYNLDLFGPDGTYGWIDDLRGLDTPPPCPEYMVDSGFLYLQWPAYAHPWISGPDAREDSILLSVMHYNLRGTSQFLRLREGGIHLEGAHSDLLGVLSKLESSVDFIRNIRTGETEESVIKLADLTGLDSDISAGGDKPNFMAGWTSIEDVLDFTRDLYSGTVSFGETFGDTMPTLFEWELNLRALYVPGISDWKDKLPYHAWDLPSGRWLVCEDRFLRGGPWGGGSWNGVVLENGSCVWKTIPNVNSVTETAMVCELPAGSYLWLTDPSGNPIVVGSDPGDERFPYFPDYTFGGLFPDMTRQRWVQLVELLGNQFGNSPPIPHGPGDLGALRH
jgi:hypothetical protein